VPEAGETRDLINKITESHSAEQLATALITMWQDSLPTPASLRVLSPGSVKKMPREKSRDGEERGERSRAPREAGSWFRLSVGREDRADPKWLVPMLCRLGGIKKQDIGAIRIQPDHTLVEIAQDKAERFQACAAATDPDEISVEPAAAPRQHSAYKGKSGRGGSGGEGGPGKRAPRKGGGGGAPFKGASSRKRKEF
jgi:ATP-dependent RNA helicase DeaD